MAPSVTTFRSWLPPRRPDAHKNNFGHVLVLGGSRGLMGAPRLAAWGALRGGAGLVTMAVPESLEPIAAGGPWEAMTLPLPEKNGVLSVRALPMVRRWIEARRVSAVVLGPGLGGGAGVTAFVRGFLATLSVPTVLDADGLNALARGGFRWIAAPWILTPHAGEMARLLGTSASEVQKDRRGSALSAARRFKAVVVLKGRGTLVTDGDREFKNSTGNPGMATGGTGDVLGGLTAALLGQVSAKDVPERLWRAAVLGAHLHGLAGDLAGAKTGRVSLIAGDVAAHLPLAFRRTFSV
ncbi:MAG: NAD(P)H-hydrate dehydratase [Elusimicrobia bacterium]|nr:NAD(P)H-hydrate dehydratase [Elusimicrobiota bacterium]